MRIIVEVRGTMLVQAVRTLLWSETTDDGEPLDTLYAPEHVSHTTMLELTQDVVGFVNMVINSLDKRLWELVKNDPEQAGYDFILSRNGHGTGFWDRGNGYLGDALHEYAKTFGTMNLYVGNDGLLYN